MDHLAFQMEQHEPLAIDSFRETRREERVALELPVRCRRGVERRTVMLKDLTPHGARIAGLGKLHLDEPVTLLLPGLRPKESWVAWSNDHDAGVEFERPLHPAVFGDLVAEYAIGHGRAQDNLGIRAA